MEFTCSVSGFTFLLVPSITSPSLTIRAQFVAGLSICTSQPLKLQPGQWLIQYTSTSPLKVRTDGGDQVVQIQPSDFFVMIETDALKFLSLIQRRHPALIESFNIITRYAAT